MNVVDSVRDDDVDVWLRVVRSSGAYCPHRQVQPDERTREVKCGKCGIKLDPFDALVMLARDWGLFEVARNASKKEAERLRGIIDELKRDERNARARLKLLMRREGDNK